jgi:hypothetical protein
MNKLLMLGLLALAGCTTQTQTIYRYAPRPEVIEPQTQAVHMKGVKWQVLTKKELQAKLVELEKNPDPSFVLFALTPDGMKNLQSNLVEINRFVSEQDEVIKYYRVYTQQTQTIPTPKAKPNN